MDPETPCLFRGESDEGLLETKLAPRSSDRGRDFDLDFFHALLHR
jgi:hypothetical protein